MTLGENRVKWYFSFVSRG